MAIEIEKKYLISPAEQERIIDVLTSFGAEYQGEDLEENTIYSGESLSKNGAILRVRTIGQRTLLTYKKRTGDIDGIKQQVEEETEVSNADALRAIIAELGLKPALIYEKRRRTWKFRSVEVMMDELPFGLYMEIEGSITAIREAELLLDADSLETEHQTYPRLTSQKGSREGNVVSARF